MATPGLSRGIPGAIMGFAIGALTVLILRQVQGMEPVWDNGVALVLTPFTMMAGWLWGVGAFNPKMSEHGHHAEDHGGSTALATVDGDETALALHHDHPEEEVLTPFGLLMSTTWRIVTYVLTLFIFFFAVAALPTGFYLQQANQPEAQSAAIAGTQSFDLPLGAGSFEASQLTVLLGFLAFTMLSVVVLGGLFGLLLINGQRAVLRAQQTAPAHETSAPPAPVRAAGRRTRRLARNLRTGIPKFFGQK